MVNAAGRVKPARALLFVAIAGMVVSLIGFIVALILNAFVLDDYDAYGEVPIPGSSSVHLPAGEVTITFHTTIIGSTSGGGLPIPDLGMNINPPAGLPKPEVTESIGTTTTVNNDARIRVWVTKIATEGTYDVETDGKVSAFINPRLAFGHGSPLGSLPWIFAAVFGFSLLDLVIALVWSSRAKRRASVGVGAQSFSDFSAPPVSYDPVQSYLPTDDGVRIEQLKTLAALRDSGALTAEEFESEKRRVLDGN